MKTEIMADLHYGYVKELAKLNFIAEYLSVKADEFSPEGPCINGVVFVLADLVNALQGLNDRLDKAGSLKC